ncbi:carboxymuconolactone decarboxylase family protein [Dethiosulfatarculus sandiegensis]|uniref:4-carboxymuconolactone decarboxylase n=1 Tax=Dethiosulfatarculus sandiegensis TaxID=1429043 RepID=A0A0D2J526_9BACT|nr:carboxymuconolactone decarboxylase family protein [Dethiosulfatarculus sandiegensis]KIX13234.1 4-carboxymuconolactone decarboxylase [Dethiosulfatarculus sandiegensis]
MAEEKTVKQKTAETAHAYFNDFPWDRPYDLWRSFDKDLAKDLSLFITGQMYAREKLPHPTRQLVAISALTALERTEELRMHIWAGLNVGLDPEEIAEAIFQVAIYAGMPVVNQALKVLREVLDKKKEA